VRAKGWWAT